MSKYKITIATGIYPPEIGGPSLYAKELFSVFTEMGQKVTVVTYGKIKKLPAGLRHIIYFFRLIPSVLRSDVVVALDTFSAGFPAVLLARLLRKKILMRVGGDFLWESYIERTKDAVLLSEFYEINLIFTKKEKYIFAITKFIFSKVDAVVFTTEWQKNIMMKPYAISEDKIHIIENVYEEREKRHLIPKTRVILSPSRDRVLKNKHGLQRAFEMLKNRFGDVSLDVSVSDQQTLLKRISHAYCVVVPSFSEVSPNLVLDAISMGVPVVATSDCGIHDRLGDCVVWVSPREPKSIAEGLEKLMDATTYHEYMHRISLFSYIHTMNDIALEYIKLFEIV